MAVPIHPRSLDRSWGHGDSPGSLVQTFKVENTMMINHHVIKRLTNFIYIFIIISQSASNNSRRFAGHPRPQGWPGDTGTSQVVSYKLLRLKNLLCKYSLLELLSIVIFYLERKFYLFKL